MAKTEEIITATAQTIVGKAPDWYIILRYVDLTTCLLASSATRGGLRIANACCGNKWFMSRRIWDHKNVIMVKQDQKLAKMTVSLLLYQMPVNEDLILSIFIKTKRDFEYKHYHFKIEFLIEDPSITSIYSISSEFTKVWFNHSIAVSQIDFIDMKEKHAHDRAYERTMKENQTDTEWWRAMSKASDASLSPGLTIFNRAVCVELKTTTRALTF